MKKFILLLGGLISLATLKAQIPNAGFEKWDTTNIIIFESINPHAWMTNNIVFQSKGANDGVKPTTDSHSGKYAMLLETPEDTSVEKQPASAFTFNGNMLSMNGNMLFPVSEKPASFSGFYKFTTPQPDYFEMISFVYKNGEIIGMAEFHSNSEKTEWTPFSVNFTYEVNETPDSASISIVSSTSSTPVAGSKLIIDDLSFATVPSGIQEKRNETSVQVYPNPAHNRIIIQSNNQISPAEIRMVNIAGQNIENINKEEISTGTLALNLPDLNPGIYFLTILDGQKSTIHKIQIQ